MMTMFKYPKSIGCLACFFVVLLVCVGLDAILRTKHAREEDAGDMHQPQQELSKPTSTKEIPEKSSSQTSQTPQKQGQIWDEISFMYSHCRSEGTWTFKLQKERGRRKLNEPGITEEERTKALDEIAVIDALNNGDIFTKLIWTTCDILGPKEPPDELWGQMGMTPEL